MINFDEKFTLYKLLTRSLSKSIINEMEHFNQWKNDRHRSYPTYDFELTEVSRYYTIVLGILYNQLFPEISKKFGVNEENIGINELFVVKYHMNGQKELRAHTDGSDISFIIGLNENFTGGGTYFTKTEDLVKLSTGDCLVFYGGENEHRGNKITSGTRYILTGFLHLKNL